MNAYEKKSKWFWAWQDDREEQWLAEMSRQGLHLQHAGAFGQYTFKRGTPREYAYRLDFVANARKNPDYYQLFQDAGWEHVGDMGGWQYWRKEIVEGRVPEIFTDNASKILKYQRLIGFLVIFFPFYVIFLTNPSIRVGLEDGSWISTVYEVLFFIFFLIIMVLAFSMLKIAQRISSLKGK
jgi:hypothetical protein